MSIGNGKTALVTGAASGIGLVTATGLAREGFHVVLLARSAQASLEVLPCGLARRPPSKRRPQRSSRGTTGCTSS